MTEDTRDDTPNTAELDAAFSYVNLGWTITPIPYGQKGPKHEGWSTSECWVDDVHRVLSSFDDGERHNIGLIHEPSRTVAIDIDNLEHTRTVFAAFGVDIEEVLRYGMRILTPKTNRAKVLFQIYGDDADLKYEKLAWPNPDDPSKQITIFELRTGIKQDVLPPSKHPDGGHYEWAPGQDPWTKKQELDGYLPMMPKAMTEFWRALNQPEVREQAKAMCPWLPDEPAPDPSTYRVRERRVSGQHQDIIGKFNQTFGVGDVLRELGYKRQGKRWLAPESSTGVAGVNVFKDPLGHERAFSHHASDPLNNGYAHDAFDVFLLRRWGGDVNLEPALDDAARRLGIMDRNDRPLEVDPNVRQSIYDMIERTKAAQEAQEAREQAAAASVALGMTPQAWQEPAGGVFPLAVAPQYPMAQKNAPDAPGGDWPAPLMRPGGIMQLAMDWMLRTATRPQPVLALAAVLSMFATALANKVTGPRGARTNLYVIGVAKTGMGKDHGRRCIKRAMHDAGLEELLAGEDIASAAALEGRAAVNREALFQIDEFGLFMQALTHKNADSHKREIGSILLRLFSSAGTLYKGKEYADQKARPRNDIESPCVNLHGTTTPETLWEALSGADITSGQLGRWIIMPTPEAPVAVNYDNLDEVTEEPPPELLIWLQCARKLGLFEDWMPPGLNPSGPGHTVLPAAAHAMAIPLDPWAKSQFTDFLREADQRLAGSESTVVQDLWARAAEHAGKIALVVAMGRVPGPELQMRSVSGPGMLMIDGGSMRWSIDFVRHVIHRTIQEVGAKVNDSEFGAWRQEVHRVVNKMGIHGATMNDLSINSRTWRYVLDARTRKSVMQVLMDDGDVMLMRFTVMNGRTRQAWVSKDVLAQHLQKFPDSEPVGGDSSSS